MGRNQNHSFSAHPKGWLTNHSFSAHPKGWPTKWGGGAINNHSFSAHPKGGLLSGAQSKPLILAHPKGWLTKWATANAVRKDGLLSGAQEPINAIAGNKAPLLPVQTHDTY